MPKLRAAQALKKISLAEFEHLTLDDVNKLISHDEASPWGLEHGSYISPFALAALSDKGEVLLDTTAEKACLEAIELMGTSVDTYNYNKVRLKYAEENFNRAERTGDSEKRRKAHQLYQNALLLYGYLSDPFAYMCHREENKRKAQQCGWYQAMCALHTSGVLAKAPILSEDTTTTPVNQKTFSHSFDLIPAQLLVARSPLGNLVSVEDISPSDGDIAMFYDNDDKYKITNLGNLTWGGGTKMVKTSINDGKIASDATAFTIQATVPFWVVIVLWDLENQKGILESDEAK